MPNAPRSTRTYRKRRTTTARRYARKPSTQVPRRKRRSYARNSQRKPVERAVYAPQAPQRQVGNLPFSKVFHARLPWVWDTDLTTPATSLAGSLYYVLNSVYDPDAGVGGHQPMQYDQLSGIYRSYIVHACKLDLEFTNPTSDAMYVGYNLYHTDSNLQASGKTLWHIKELSRATVRPIVDSGKQRQKFSIYIPIHKLLGIPKVVYTSDRASYSAAWNANPAKLAVVEPFAINTAGVATTVHFSIKLTYYTELYDYLPQGTS